MLWKIMCQAFMTNVQVCLACLLATYSLYNSKYISVSPSRCTSVSLLVSYHLVFLCLGVPLCVSQCLVCLSLSLSLWKSGLREVNQMAEELTPKRAIHVRVSATFVQVSPFVFVTKVVCFSTPLALLS